MAIQVSIEGYDSLEQIGVGGMAAVYRARKVSIDKVVAIKVLFPYLANDESFIERFQREAKSAAKLQHENIVNVIDYGESEGAYYIVMEYYEGLTLEEILKQHGAAPLDIAVLILLEVCFGLEAAHAKDIIHRDVKPGNIICTHQGGIKIADFGLAKNTGTASVVTQAGKVIGTPAFMSPEQAAGRDVGPPSDIFSLGVVAYEMFCQKRPFEGETYSEVLEQIQTVDPPPISEANPLIQPDFEAIVRKMLEKDLSRRYRDVTEVISDMERAMEKFDIPRDRRRLSKYIEDPGEYLRAFKKKLISRCLSQGTYFLQKGRTHLEDAELEFKRILYLDPENERAKRYLLRISAELGKNDKTVECDKLTTTSAAVAPKGALKQEFKRKRAKPPPRTERKRKRRKWPIVVPLVLAIGLVGVWIPHRSGKIPWEKVFGSRNTPPALSAPAKLTVSEGETVEFDLQAMDAEGSSVTFSGEGFPQGASLSPDGQFRWKVAYNQSGIYVIRFFADDGEAVSKTETVIDAQDTRLSINFKKPPKQSIREGEELKLTLSARSQIGRPVEFKLDSGPEGMEVHGDRLIWKPASGQTGTFTAKILGSDGYARAMQMVEVRVKPKVEKPAPKPAPGMLSVYYLGGVGEFLLDGEKFSQQPPFTGAQVTAGRHIVTCRMFKDGSSKEFEITIQPGKETIIEYELGKEPVVRQEN
ncbi:MAG: protein kinase [Candidatus Latescibacteria bacterium]|nr:protein kinase [Candidatus Latescibacterota bacterium]NIO78665.1 protein kinase [Candidatus Latescibacterota bacterium]